jgi:hypothetical protein
VRPVAEEMSEKMQQLAEVGLRLVKVDFPSFVDFQVWPR